MQSKAIVDFRKQRSKILEEEIIECLKRAEEDYKNGRTRKAEDVFKEWKEKYGI